MRLTNVNPLLNGYRGYFSQLADIGKDHTKRVNKIRLLWDFYEGLQWDKPTPDVVTCNYVKLLVDTKANFFTKNGFNIQVEEDDNTERSELTGMSFVKVRLDDAWKANNKLAFLDRMAQMGGVTGDAFVRISWDREANDVKMTLLPSHYVFPEYDALNPDNMIMCHIIWPDVDRSKRKDTNGVKPWGDAGTADEVVWKRETWTKTSVRVVYDNKIQSIEENPFGEIPVVHVRNFENSNSVFGFSDVEPLIPAQRAYNETVTDINDIIEYHGSPITHVKGGRMTDVQMGPDQIWTTSQDVDIKHIELTSDLKANIEFLERLYRVLLDISGVPEQAINPTKNVSNTPGVALHMAYLPLIENRATKIKAYGTGIEKINRFILKYLEIGEPKFSTEFNKLDEKRRYDTKISFGEALPRDEAQKLEHDRSRLIMGIATRKMILMEDGYGEGDAERIIKEADAELEHRARIKGSEPVQPGTVDDAFGKQRRPDPVVQGDKVSAKSGGASI